METSNSTNLIQLIYRIPEYIASDNRVHTLPIYINPYIENGNKEVVVAIDKSDVVYMGTISRSTLPVNLTFYSLDHSELAHRNEEYHFARTIDPLIERLWKHNTYRKKMKYDPACNFAVITKGIYTSLRFSLGVDEINFMVTRGDTSYMGIRFSF